MRGETPAVSRLQTIGSFLGGRACSDTMLHVINRAYGVCLPDEERAAQILAGGIMQHGFQCGMLWGAALAAGARAHQLLGAGPRAEAMAVMAAQGLATAFRTQNGHADCIDITGIDRSSSTAQMVVYFLFKGGTAGCMRMAARYAPEALRAVETALSRDLPQASSGPASCAAELARAMGAEEQHAVMAAGLAGGLGLGGGACGALGAAIWLLTLREVSQGYRAISLHSPAALAAIKRFLGGTGGEFTCARIVGRAFTDAEDHARHVGSGGCADILRALAAA